jgi:hypothetical protein
VVAIMVAIIVPLAITASPSNPPAIAEFAPEALQQIKEAPKQQGSTLGNGPLGEGGSGILPSPSALAALLPTPSPPLISVRHCIGTTGSLRQIEDPQSPPCVPFFNGPNGGSTWKGVTGNEITVAVANGEDPRLEQDLINFFNHRFEFYGRKLKLVHYNPADACADPANAVCGQPTTPSQQQADAQLVDEKLHAFADLGYREAGFGTTFSFYDALATRQILSVQDNLTEEPRSDQAHLTQYAPYEWNFVQTPDQIQRNLADLDCNELAGKKPIWAGSAISQTAPKRVFGLVHAESPDGTASVDTKPLSEGVKRCGVTMVEEGIQENSPNTAKLAIVDMQKQGVTTVVCICHQGNVFSELMPQATSQGYYPEWMLQHYMRQDDEGAAYTYPPDQAVHFFGLRVHNKIQLAANTPYGWAVHEEDPSYGVTGEFDALYLNLLVLASGIQMAGPHLTPQTFEDGLFRTRFPNPGADGPPWYQARVGFGPGNHSMEQTEVRVWWSNSGQGTGEGRSETWCYVDAGRRYGIGEWPAEDPAFFTPPCR